MKCVNFCIVLLIINLFSCNSYVKDYKIDKTSSVQISIDLKKMKSANLTDLIDSVHYIKLQQNKQSPIGTFNKVICDDQHVFILDLKTESVFLFDFKGKFINKISSKRNGYSESIFIRDFGVDKAKKEIFIADPIMRKVFFYNYSGKYVRHDNFTIPISPYAINQNAGRNVFLFPDNDYETGLVTYIDGQVNIEKKYLPVNYPKDKYRFFPSLSNPITEFKHEAYFTVSGSESIFKFSHEKLQEAYKLRFGPYNYADILDRYYKSKDEVPLENFSSKYNLPLSMDNLSVSDSIISLRFLFPPKSVHFFLNTRSKKYFLFDGYYMGTRVYLIPNQIVGTTGNFFISVISPEQVIKTNEFISKYPKLQQQDRKGSSTIADLSHGLNLNDDPILMCYSIKRIN